MRFHNLKYIEKVAEVPADALSGHSSSGGSATSTTKYTVADLYSFVKNYDKDFTTGKPVNKEFARGFVYFKVGDNGYSADVVVGTNTNGIAILYDLVNIVPQKITEATDTIQGNSQVSRRDASDIIDTTTPSSGSQSPKSTKDRAVMTTERIDYLIDDSGAGMRKDYAQLWITSINPTDFLNMTLGEKNQRKC